MGACFATKKPTIVFLGDAAAEEDYVLGALGWASHKKLPILFIIEDNDFSILTKKNVRRNWNMKDVARSFKLEGHDIKDHPKEIIKNSKVNLFLVEDQYQIAKLIKSNVYGKKIVIGMGAGTISSWIKEMPELLK